MSKCSSEPPHITVSWPLTAPAWPPETGASTKPTPRAAAVPPISLASAADAVVWSTSSVPGASPASTPSSPSTTERTSSSLPTHTKAMSARAAASRGVGADVPP